MSTSYVREVLVLTYFSHQKDNKHLSIYRKIKSQDGFHLQMLLYVSQ